MPRAIFAIGAIVALVLSGQAAAYESTSIPVPKKTEKLHQSYKLLHAKASSPKSKAHAGRNVLQHGRPKDGKISHSLIKREFKRIYVELRPCSRVALEEKYRTGKATSWETMVATWRCDGMPEWRINFLSCIADHEGGRTYPDVSYGGGRGYGPLEDNIVMGHNQLRPAWYRGAMEGRPGTYAGDYWTYDLYVWAINPVNQARATAPLGASQYATAGMC